MNFMSGRTGFYDEITGSRGISSTSSSSSSSSFHHRPQLPPYHESYAGGGAPPQDSSPTNNGDDNPEDSDDHMLFRRGGGEGSSAATATVIQREHMFDKVVTPSDVGKLNRLVIPKQHAEKYFPLDSSTNEKGLLLNFEDRNGKAWRFRYSYWNSSQSYVMTKGWSRFVKEKKLDAGDIVSFQRGVGELAKDRLFIDWRRRPDAVELHPSMHHHHHHHHSLSSIPNQFSFHQRWSPLFMPPPPPPPREYSQLLQQQYHQQQHHMPSGYGPYAYSNIVNGNPCPPGSIVYLRSAPGGGAAVGGQQQQMGQRGGVDAQMVFESVPVVQGKAAAKRLRLFGVNMDCPISESDECDILSTSTTATAALPPHHATMPPPPNFQSFSSSSLQLRPNYSDDDKGKGSMSLDLDI